VLLAYRIPEYKHADFPALSLLATILGQGESSRINKAVVRDLKLAQFSVSLLNPASPRRGPGVFLTLAVVNQGVVVDSLEQALAAQVGRIATEGVTRPSSTRRATRTGPASSRNNSRRSPVPKRFQPLGCSWGTPRR
jgi:predicted Zn-dependent peptidase